MKNQCFSVSTAACWLILLTASLRAANTVLDFGSSGGSAVVPYSPALNPGQITVETWFLASSFSGEGSNPLVDKPYYSHSSPHYQYLLAIVGDQYLNSPRAAGFGVTVGGVIHGASVESAYTVGQWYHMAGTYDGETIFFYINGKLVASNTAPSGPIGAFTTNLNIASYGSNVPSAAATPVRLEELRIWSYARSQGEIRAAMNQELAGSESGLIAYYNFNTPSTTTLFDQTGNHNGTLNNIALSQFTGSSPVPEPGTVVLVLLGLGGFAMRRSRAARNLLSG